MNILLAGYPESRKKEMWVQTEDNLTLLISFEVFLGVAGKETGKAEILTEIFLYLVRWAKTSPTLTAAVFQKRESKPILAVLSPVPAPIPA